MKSVFCIFLSVYVLLLSGLPCADGGLQLRAGMQTVTLAADDHPHPVDHSAGDRCSPLCICSCCGTTFDTPPHFQFSYLSEPQIRPVECFGPITIAFSSPTLPTWQPPQLG